MYRTRLGFPAAVAIICVATGCGKSGSRDQALTTDIQSKLYADAATKPANINVAVKDGAVTLSGDVPSSDAELQAVKIANGTAGVKTVSDQLKVNPATAGNGAPPAPDQTQPAPPPTGAPVAGASAPAQAPPAEAPRPPEPTFVTIPAGERVSVRMIDSIDSSKSSAGQEFQASLDAPLTHGDRVVIPARTPCTVTLENVKSAGRIKGQSEVAIVLTSIHYGGRSYAVNTRAVEQQGNSRGKQTAVRTGIGAAAGALIGGLAGGGKGAAIGSAAGGGAGFGFNALTHGSQVKIPSETVLAFQLQAPLKVERK